MDQPLKFGFIPIEVDAYDPEIPEEELPALTWDGTNDL